MLKTLDFYLVDHQGLDRLRRVACRLPPRLPARSPSERSLLECSPDILADARALAGSNRLDKKENTQKTLSVRWWIIRGSNPGHPD